MSNYQKNKYNDNQQLKNQQVYGQGSKAHGSTLNSVFSNNSQLMNSGINSKTQSMVRNSLVQQQAQQQQMHIPPTQKNLASTSNKFQSQTSLMRDEQSRNDFPSQANLEGDDQKNNINVERTYRPLIQTDAIKYANKQKSNQNKGECILNLLNDEQEISTNLYSNKRKELNIFKTQFIDSAEFPSNDQSLGFQTNSSQVIWHRLTNLYPKGNIFPQQSSLDGLNTGIMNNDHLFCIYSILIRNQHLIRRLFETQTLSDKGIYCVWLFINGIWQNILIDDFIPFKVGQENQPLFSSLKDKENSLWILILEKALAKAFKKVYLSLVNFTGAPYLLISKRDHQQSQNKKANQEQDEKNKTWQKIKNGLKKGYILTAKSQVNERGLVIEQTYFIEDAKEFKLELGDFSRIIKLWNCRPSQQVQNFINFNNLTQDQVQELQQNSIDKGIFYLNYDEFYKKFDQFAIVRVESNDYYNSIKLKQGVQNETDYSTIRLKTNGQVSGYLCLWQQELEFQTNKNYSYSYFSIILAEVQQNGTLKYISYNFSNEKVTHFPFNLNGGMYIIHVEARWSQNEHRDFRISICSDQPVGLQYYDYKEQNLNGETILNLIGKNYMEEHGIDFKSENTKSLGKKGQLGMFYIYYLKNITQKYILKQIIEVKNISNYEIIDKALIGKDIFKTFQIIYNIIY